MLKVLAGALEVESHVVVGKIIQDLLYVVSLGNEGHESFIDDEEFFETVINHNFFSIEESVCCSSHFFVVVPQLRTGNFKQIKMADWQLISESFIADILDLEHSLRQRKGKPVLEYHAVELPFCFFLSGANLVGCLDERRTIFEDSIDDVHNIYL
jgi:hypothetical protein